MSVKHDFDSKLNPKKYRHTICIAILLAILAFSLRIAYQNNTVPDAPVRADAISYVSAAYNLAHFGVYSTKPPTVENKAPPPDNERTPGYPLFLYPFFKFSDTPHQAIEHVFIAQAIVGTLTVVLSFLLARLFWGYGYASIIGLLVAITPQLITLEYNLLTETLFTFIQLAAVYTLVLAFRIGGWRLVFLAGIFFGFAALTRPIAMLAGPLVALSILFVGNRARHLLPNRYTTFLILLTGFLICQAPYYLRNHITLGDPFAGTSLANHSFLQGTYPNLTHHKWYGYPYREDKLYNQMIADPAFEIEVLTDRFTNDPWKYINWYLFGKLKTMWQWDLAPGGYKDVYVYPMKHDPFKSHPLLNKIRTFLLSMHMPICIIALLGFATYFVKLFKVDSLQSILLLPIFTTLVYNIGLLIIMFPLPRYTVPLRPFLYLFAGYAIAVTLSKATNIISATRRR